MEWIEKLADGGIEEATALVDVVALESLVEEMIPELSVDEQTDLAYTIKNATVNQMTVGQLRDVNAYVADKYLLKLSDLLKASVKVVTSPIIVGDRVFAKSSGELGKVTRIVKAGEAGFESAEKVYEARYGLQHSRKGAGALYQVTHEDGGYELYYDTEVEATPLAIRPLVVKGKEQLR